MQDQFEYLVASAKGKIPDPTPEEVGYDYGNAIIDDLMGNSAHLASSPTPTPLYLGGQYQQDKRHHKMKLMMEDYQKHLQQLAAADKDAGVDVDADVDADADEKSSSALMLAPPLPSDKKIALLLRSYRDTNSKSNLKSNHRRRPLGIVKALRYIISDVGIPTTLFGKKTYSSLMACAANPTEARRIMKLMEDNDVPIDTYIYSILVDIYAKRGDYKSADEVISEMRLEGIQPTLPAYTSLMAACYKSVNSATVPQKVKAEAASLAWDRWKEIQINGMDPDVMAYGAIIRIMAARGLAERALNIVEEMELKEVKPTTLIFTSALKAVARSHARALRFEGGRGKKLKYRESITAHHGKMARNIVIKAEQSGIEEDDGYIQALMLCAGTAGDSATVKAIYLANEVRKLDDLRTFGGAEHLQLLEGSKLSHVNDDLKTLGKDSFVPSASFGDSSEEIDEKDKILSSPQEMKSLSRQRTKQYKPRDTRILNSLLMSYANALENSGLGDMWAGGIENKGYLCENSLRFIQMRKVPKYVDNSIHGIDGTETVEWDDNEDVQKMGKRLRRQKFLGAIKDTKGNSFDSLDPKTDKLFFEEEFKLFEEFQDTDLETRKEMLFKDFNFPIESSKTETPIDAEKFEGRSQSPEETSDDIDPKVIDFDKIVDSNKDMSNAETKLRMAQKEQQGLMNTLVDDKFEIVEVEGKDKNEIENMPQSNDYEIIADDLSRVLHGMPETRIRKVREEFQTNLGLPSMIRLVPILRENMPEVISKAWLVQKNLRDAEVVMQKAKEERVIDLHLMNSMLQVLAKSNDVNGALEYYDSNFLDTKYRISMSDRTIFQMLIEKSQISRALDFKENKIEKFGKHIDLISYGSLIDYYGRHAQVGSAIMAVKECISVHGAPPGEKSLSKLRLLCRQSDTIDEVMLNDLIGADPLEWVREGERVYKREYSKRGNAQIDVPGNKMLNI